MNKKIVSTVLAAAVALSASATMLNLNKVTASSTKTLIYARGADSRGLDPAWVDDGESAKVMCNIFEGLTKYDPDSTKVEPCLATHWDVTNGGKTYTFDLRKGVKFQDGTPFNADAVVFSINRQLPPLAKPDMPYASFTFDPSIVDKVVKVSEYKVKILLKKPYTPFLANLAMALAAPIVSPTAVKKYGSSFIKHPVGTGPFKFDSWTPDQSIVLLKNTSYWGTKAKCDKVVFLVTKENSVRASQLITGGADIIDGVDANDIKKITDSKMKLFSENGMNINYMAFNCSRAPFNNPKLREAISYAINTDELIKGLYRGYSKKAISPLPSFIPGASSTVKPYSYNPQKAKALLKQLGKQNLKITMITYTNPRPYNPVNGQKLAEAIQNQLANVGVKATINSYDWTTYKKKAAQGEGDVMFYGWTGDNGDADNFLSLFDSSQIASSLNTSFYKSAAVDKLLDQGRTTPNGPARDKIYYQVQDIIAKDAPWVTISHANDMAAYSPKVSGFKLHPTGVVFLAGVDKK